MHKLESTPIHSEKKDIALQTSWKLTCRLHYGSLVQFTSQSEIIYHAFKDWKKEGSKSIEPKGHKNIINSIHNQYQTT